MTKFPRIARLTIAGLLCSAALGGPLAAQQSGADSARVLLEAARVLQAKGEAQLASQVLRLLRLQWPDSPAAREAGTRLAATPAGPLSGFARTGFVTYHTMLGAWLGVAIPGALGVDGPEPYGLGLLIGAPAGFIGSRAFARKHAITEGQAGLITFASEFGIWQAVGWRAQLNIGHHEVCPPNNGGFCYTESSDRAPFTASILGAAAGIGVGLAAGRPSLSAGTAALISQGGYWGTWFGFATAVLADADNGEHGALSAALVGGDLGVGLAIPLARAWHPSSARVHLISAGGLAGGLAGLGVSLLFNVDEGKTAMGIVLAGNVLGMVAAGTMTRDRTEDGASISAPARALLTVRDGVRWGLPTPAPTVIPLRHRVGGRDRVVGLRFGLLDADF